MLRSAADPEKFDIVTEVFSAATLSADAYDLALPFTRKENELIQGVPEAASRTLLPSESHRRLGNDKLAFAQWLVDAGFRRNVPKFAVDPIICFPLIRKRRIGANGQRCRLYVDEADLVDDPTTPDESDFYQECIRGQREYATHTISVAGTVLFMGTTVSVHDADVFVKGKGEIPSEISPHANVAVPEIKGIIAALGYTGHACFDYKLKADMPMFFEMNPRIGYSSYLYADVLLETSLRALACLG